MTLKMPSGEFRLINEQCRATFGEISNAEHNLRNEGKAGRKRWKGIRPTVRGTAMNPVDHPHGGGREGIMDISLRPLGHCKQRVFVHARRVKLKNGSLRIAGSNTDG